MEVYRAVCDCGHAFVCKRRAHCSDDREPKKATKRRRAFECEEVMVGRNGGYLFRLETHTRVHVLSH